MCLPRVALLLMCVCLVGVRATAEEPADEAAPAAKVSFYNDIRPIFQDRCQGCHQPAKPLGGLVMTSYAAIRRGGESETPGFVPGNPDESELLSQIMPLGDEPPLMPKDGAPLSKDQIALVRRWIEEGAADDTPDMIDAVIDMDHPPVYTAPSVITSLDYSPDGTLLAVSGYHEVLLHRTDVSAASEAASNDAKAAADATADSGAETNGEAATAAPASPTGTLVARLIGLSERIESARFSPDGKLLAVTGGSPGRFGEVQIWDVATRQLKQSVLVTYDTVYGASWSRDGTKLAFGCADNTCRAIDVASGKQVFFQGVHTDWVLDTVFSADDSHLVSVSRDRSMKLYDVATERFVDNVTSITPGALKGGLISVDRHPEKDELLAGGADGTPKIYQMHRTQDRKIGDDFNLIRAGEQMPGRIFSVCYNRDGSRILAGSSDDGKGEVRVYNEADGKTIARFGDQYGPVYAVAYRPDGRAVATGGFDGQVRIWDPESGKLLSEFLPVPVAVASASAEPEAEVAQAAGDSEKVAEPPTDSTQPEDERTP